MATLNTDDVAKRIEYAIKRCARVLLDVRQMDGDLYVDVRSSRFVSNMGDLLTAELVAWGFDAERGKRQGAGLSHDEELTAAVKPTKKEIDDQLWSTLDGLVWALRAEDVPVQVITQRVAQASEEYDPSPRPAFTIIDGGGLDD